MYYIIKNIEDLKKLPSKKNIKFRRILIQHPHIDKNITNKLEEKLNKNYFACGCKTGSFFTFFGILICLTHAIIEIKQFSLNNLLYYLLIIIISALAGKLVGLSNANIKLVKIRKRIAKLYSMDLYEEDAFNLEKKTTLL